MGNNLIFSGKRESFLDCQLWLKAIHKIVGQVEQSNGYKTKSNRPKTMEEVIGGTESWCCSVDSSWISVKHKAGIGWVLKDQRGNTIMKGSTSIDPIASSLEAEAFSLRDVVQQVRIHGYKNVVFLGDSKTTFDTLGKYWKKSSNSHLL